MAGRKRAEEFCHSGSDPSVTAAPKKGNVRNVKEEAVGWLQFVQMGRNFARGAVNVFGIAAGAISLHLYESDYVHAGDPEPALRSQAVGRGVLPLLVGHFEAEV